MDFKVYSHHQCHLSKKIREEIESAITQSAIEAPVSTKKLRSSILGVLHNCGWTDGVKIKPTSSKIDITSMRENVGLCFQTGNMSRLYADLLKLQTLFVEGRIHSSIIVVPQRRLARYLGDNIVHYERFVRELEIFGKTITVPILLYGIEKENRARVELP